MKHFTWLLLFPLLFSFTREKVVPQTLPYIIPEQRFDIFREMGYEKAHDTVVIGQFRITRQVTLGEYREYLAVVKKDSSEAYYKTQLPDSTMGAPENYKAYMSNPAYNCFPALGVSWDNAMNYLRWLTVHANKDNVYDTIYRLPVVTEWVAAYRYFKTVDALKNEMNHDYADWTMNAFDESYYDFTNKHKLTELEYGYYAAPGDPRVLKRKRVMGNSFHYSAEELRGLMNWYYYEFHGYAHISFRYVVVVISAEQVAREKKYGILKYWGLDK